ncbi:MAG: hypothetical protein ACI80K_004238, partial [Paracoccaceae bacterium]
MRLFHRNCPYGAGGILILSLAEKLAGRSRWLGDYRDNATVCGSLLPSWGEDLKRLAQWLGLGHLHHGTAPHGSRPFGDVEPIATWHRNPHLN